MKNLCQPVPAGLYIFLFLNTFLISGCDEHEPIQAVAGSPVQVAVNANVQPSSSLVVADASAILGKAEVPVLCYHQLRDFKPSDSKTAKDYIVPGNSFREQMKLLSDSGYHSILPDQLYDYLTYGKPLPDKPVMITFDDTRLEHFEVAVPEMNKYGFKGAFFIMTVSLNRPGYMTKEQVRQLADEGHTVGLHTWNHQNVKTFAEEDWSIQIVKPSEQLKQITGKPVDYFAYPFGLWNKPALERIKDHGFKAAFQLSARRDENLPLFSIRRIIVPGEWSAARMQKYMEGSFRHRKSIENN